MVKSKSFEEECKGLMHCCEEVNVLATYLMHNHPEQIKYGGEAVDIAMRVLDTMK